MTSKKANIFYGAFGAGLRPWPSATISYYLCNFCHPGRCRSFCAQPLTEEPQVSPLPAEGLMVRGEG